MGKGKGNGNGSGKGKSKQKQTTKSKSETNPKSAQEVDRTPTILEGSSISFYLNGQAISDQPAFQDLYDFIPLPPLSTLIQQHQGKKGEPIKGLQYDDGTLGYYPMISVFGRGKVKVNFGPTWKAPPVPDLPIGVRPVCDRYDEFREEERVQDELDELEWIERINIEMKEAEEKKEIMMKRKLAADLKRGSGTGSGTGRGRGRGRGGSNSTPRSRLGTESTPGLGEVWKEKETPSSPPESVLGSGQGQVDITVKMEDATSVSVAGSRAPSEKPDLGMEVDAEGEADLELDAEGEEDMGDDTVPVQWD